MPVIGCTAAVTGHWLRGRHMPSGSMLTCSISCLHGSGKHTHSGVKKGIQDKYKFMRSIAFQEDLLIAGTKAKCLNN